MIMINCKIKIKITVINKLRWDTSYFPTYPGYLKLWLNKKLELKVKLKTYVQIYYHIMYLKLNSDTFQMHLIYNVENSL